MKKNILHIICVFAFMFTTGMVLASQSVNAAYDPFSNICDNSREDGSGKQEESTVCQDSASTDNPATGNNGIILRVTTIVASIAGLIAVVMIVVGGVGMITSGGDTAAVKTARSRVLHALIGLVIIVLAQSIVTLIISKVLT